MFFFFKQKTAYEMRISDWSSDVCSSDLSGRSTHLLPISRRARQPHRLARRREKRAGLGFAFALFIGGLSVGDATRAPLDVLFAGLYDPGAQHDAAVHISVWREISDVATLGAAARGFVW